MQPGSAATETARFSLIEFFFWAAIVSFEAYLVPWLRGHGYTPSEAGLVVAIIAGGAVIGQPVLGRLSDRLPSPGPLITAALVVGIVAFVSMVFVASWYPALLTLAAIYAFSVASLPMVFDAWILARRERVPGLQYGIARGTGSFGFAAGGIALGTLTDRVGIGAIFPSFALAAGVAVVLVVAATRRFQRERSAAPATAPTDEVVQPIATATAMGPVQVPEEHVVRSSRPSDGPLRAVLRNRAYLTLVAGGFLGFSGLRAALTFLPYLFDTVGGSVGQVGLAHSIGALSEIPFFVGAALIHRRFRGAPLISSILILMGIRLVAYTWMPTAGAILALQISHGLTFGLFMATTVDYVHRIAPPEHRAFFQALGPALFFGVGSIVGSWLGGVLMEATSVMWLYRIAALVTLLGAPLPMLARSDGRT